MIRAALRRGHCTKVWDFGGNGLPHAITQQESETPLTADGRELERARKLVELWGDDTLSYFALRDDKCFFFASNGRAMIAYARYGGFALASGDPVGAPDSHALAVTEFVSMARRERLRVAFLAVREENLPLYRASKLAGYYYGEEALLNCRTFSLDGSARRPLRLPVNKLGKRGYRFELVKESACAADVLRELEDVRVAHHGGAEVSGFTMGLDRGITGADPSLLLAIARDPEGQVEAFLRLAPCSGSLAAYTLDLMRRRPGNVNGVNEFLIAHTAVALRELGVGRLSLNFSIYRRFMLEHSHAGTEERFTRWLLTRFEWLLPIRPLVRWNEKFKPSWIPRCIVHEPGQLLRTILLYVIAEGFVRLPFVGRLAMPRVRAHWTEGRA